MGLWVMVIVLWDDLIILGSWGDILFYDILDMIILDEIMGLWVMIIKIIGLR